MADEPLAFFLTWVTYGTWLPGDDRGWIKRTSSERYDGSRELERYSRQTLAEPPVILSPDQRRVVETTIDDHCTIRGWELRAVNCRTNHVHVIVSAFETPQQIMRQFKSWCTRRLKQAFDSQRERWWGRSGSTRYLNSQDEIEATTLYVVEGQEGPKS